MVSYHLILFRHFLSDHAFFNVSIKDLGVKTQELFVIMCIRNEFNESTSKKEISEAAYNHKELTTIEVQELINGFR